MKTIFSILVFLLILSPTALLSKSIYPKVKFSDEVIIIKFSALEIKINEFLADKELFKLNYDLRNRGKNILLSASHELIISETDKFCIEINLKEQLNLSPNEKKNFITTEKTECLSLLFNKKKEDLEFEFEDLEFQYVVHSITYKDGEYARQIMY